MNLLKKILLAGCLLGTAATGRAHEDAGYFITNDTPALLDFGYAVSTGLTSPVTHQPVLGYVDLSPLDPGAVISFETIPDSTGTAVVEIWVTTPEDIRFTDPLPSPGDYTVEELFAAQPGFIAETPEPSTLAFLAATAAFLISCRYWPQVRATLTWLAVVAVICVPVILICLVGTAADIVGWDWLGDKCAAWIGAEPQGDDQD